MSELPNNTPSPSPLASAREGKKPVVAIYSTFLQRAYDQLIHDIALQNLPVVGHRPPVRSVPTARLHHGAFDLFFTCKCIPNMVIMAPADENECRQMLYTAFMHHGPTAAGATRAVPAWAMPECEMTALLIGKGEIRRDGKRVAILASAAYPGRAGGGRGTDATVANMRFVGPLDAELIREELAAEHELLVTVEENVAVIGRGLESRWLANEAIATRTLHWACRTLHRPRGAVGSCGRGETRSRVH